MKTAAILGAGQVGRALASRLRSAGLTARFGVRRPRSAAGAEVPEMLAAEAAAGADIIFVAVPANAAIDALRAAGNLDGRVVVDCTNPLSWSQGPVWTPPAAGSNTAAIAAACPAARVVKGFNHFGAEIQAQPAMASGPADAFFAGDDSEARQIVMAVAARMGFTPHDAGPLRNAAVLENLAVLWIHLATVGGAGRTFAFRMDGQ
jgi:predicted dinucleotide-binding enzyme